MRSIIFSALAVFAAAIGLAADKAMAEDIWADHVVYNWDGSSATYTPGTGDNMTHGPFHVSAFWNNPEAILGKPNTLDRDDTEPDGGNFREINMVWPAWYNGTNDYILDHTHYLDGYGAGLTSNNGCGLAPRRVSGVMTYPQIVVEFDEVIENDPHNPYGIDFIIHGNPFFATGIYVYEDSNMDTYTLTPFGGGGEFPASGPGAVFSEPVTISVAQSLDGPWYTFTQAPGDVVVTADNFFPTQPYKWDSGSHQWLGEELDWTKPVNPWIVNYFGYQTVADSIRLYAGSAGGTPFDLDWLTDDEGNPVYLEWIKYVKFSDPGNMQGEICAAADVAPVKLGDQMSVTMFNLEVGISQLDFVDPDDKSTKLVQIVVTDMEEEALAFQTAARSDLSEYANAPANPLAAYDVNATVILDPTAPPVATANLSLHVGDTYSGDGSDLAVYQWTGQRWVILIPWDYDPASKLLTVTDVDTFEVFVIAPIPPVGDITLDNRVNLQDFAVLARFWLNDIAGLSDEMAHRADLAEDDFIDGDDLLVLVGNWLACTWDCE